MYEFISLNVKCPHCGESLMDEKQLVDNKPSIRCNIKINRREGVINLSSIYGSYNYRANIEIPHDVIGEFSCPHCNEHLATEQLCTECQAPMVAIHLKMGGRITFCSRSGCKRHSAEFEDLNSALKRFYNQYGFRAAKYAENDFKQFKKEDEHKDKTKEEEIQEENKEIIKSGTFLWAYCPHCKKSLIKDEMLWLKVVNGDEGDLMLSPYLNVFSSKSTIYLPEDKEIHDLKCPHCGVSFIVKDDQCDECGAPTAKIMVSASTKMIEFFVCSRKGCRWHGLSDEDMEDIKLDDSMEW